MLLRKVMAPASTAATSAASLRAHIVGRAMFGLQKSISLLEPRTSSFGDRARRGCLRGQNGNVSVGISNNVTAVYGRQRDEHTIAQA